MKYAHSIAVTLAVLLTACSLTGERGTLAQLRDVQPELKDARIEGGLEKAMESYRKFLEQTPDSAMTPEAIRRLADLKIEKEYGVVEAGASGAGEEPARLPTMERPERLAEKSAPAAETSEQTAQQGTRADAIADVGESERAFEKRATASQKINSAVAAGPLPEGGDDLERAGPLEAIALYKKLLAKYPTYERNDQVLYQMSRAYEELGRVDDAMGVMNRLVKEYPNSRYMDEVQFRRAEYYFMRKKFLDAEEAYQAIVQKGVVSSYYELALYKLGWAFYKQELYEEALKQFFTLLDHKVAIGFDFENVPNAIEKKRMDDTYRVISLSFSNLQGADSVVEYFERIGKRVYEVGVYSHLGEFYLTKRRYSDAAATYRAFISRNPFHKVSPHFSMRVIEIYGKGGFPKLVVEAKKEFAHTYGLKAEYWHYFDIKANDEVLGYLKTNLKDLANHYHALYQDKRFTKSKADNYLEAQRWYREFLASFPKDPESPAINYQLADLLLEQKDFGQAAIEYEKTAYDYAAHKKASEAGYAAIYAHRENLKVVTQAQRGIVKRDVVRSSLHFADTFPKHDKAPLVLGAAVDDLYEMKDFEVAIRTGHKLIDAYPTAERTIRRSAWLVIGHSSFELTKYSEAEQAYNNVLGLTPPTDKSRAGLLDNLAASIYKQGEQAKILGQFRVAADHFLRIAKVAPSSKIRPTAEYDAAAALIELKDWENAANVLVAFRKSFPGHELLPEVTKKVAFVYKEAGKLNLAAAEYERIERESKDNEVRRGALLLAGDLYEQAKNVDSALKVYRRYIEYFPSPVELALENRYKIAGIYKSRNDTKRYSDELRRIVDIDANAGSERTERTRYLGATSALVLTEPLYQRMAEIRLIQPFKSNLLKKKRAMKEALDGFGKLVSYEVGDVTAASTYYIAEIYSHFSKALMQSERPTKLNALELEQYVLALEDQAYPFEEKSIEIHEKNVEFLSLGIYNEWIEKSIAKLAKIAPARYARAEESTGFIESPERFSYALPVEAPAEPAREAAAATAEAEKVGDDPVAGTTGGEASADQQEAPGEIPADAAADEAA